MGLLRSIGWFLCDDGRLIRHSNKDGSNRGWLQRIEFGWRWDENLPVLGFYYETADCYENNQSVYLGLGLVRLYIGFGDPIVPGKRWGWEIGRKYLQAWWNYEDFCGNAKVGKHFFCIYWERIQDVVLGKAIYHCDSQPSQNGVIQMPEGDYPATFTFEKATWARPRWPFKKTLYSTDVDIPMGIPESGKGENSWDQGEDALYGTGVSDKTKVLGHSIPLAMKSVRESSLESRARRGDPECWPVPPDARLRIFEEKQKERAKKKGDLEKSGNHMVE